MVTPRTSARFKSCILAACIFKMLGQEIFLSIDHFYQASALNIACINMVLAINETLITENIVLGGGVDFGLLATNFIV